MLAYLGVSKKKGVPLKGSIRDLQGFYKGFRVGVSEK